jgi:hypothetical protein
VVVNESSSPVKNRESISPYSWQEQDKDIESIYTSNNGSNFSRDSRASFSYGVANKSLKAVKISSSHYIHLFFSDKTLYKSYYAEI